MSKLTLDLHPIFKNKAAIQKQLHDYFQFAYENKIKLLEIIHGKGSGQLKKIVLKFFEQSAYKSKLHRIDKDSKNFGRIFIRFKY
jgi:DNA-nicking Smr family endonuclease